ncbi:MAG: hypothetical protein KDK48_05360, partial [Chlamydiia bacterium]|nr:hypothetical protein [Chlamydiia bacterium]
KSYGLGALSPNTLIFDVSSNVPLTEETIDLLRTAESMRKNILLFRENAPASSKKKIIDIWWDSAYRGNFELMLSLITSLKDNARWHGARTRLQALCPSDDAKENLAEYLRDFIYHSRITMEPHLHVEGTLEKHSQDADLCFLGLQPLSQAASDKEYLQELNALLESTTAIGKLFLVISNDRIDHREGYW